MEEITKSKCTDNQRFLTIVRNRGLFVELLNDHYMRTVDANIDGSTPQSRALQTAAWHNLKLARAAAKAVR